MAQITLNLNELGIFSGCYESIWLHSETNLDELNQMTDDLGCEIESDLDFYKYLKAIAETYESYLEVLVPFYRGAVVFLQGYTIVAL